jgi:hypothetical protein
MVNVLVFDKMCKYNALKEWLGRSKSINLTYCFSPERAAPDILRGRYDIILMGGDVGTDEMKAVVLWGKLLAGEIDTRKMPYVYICTWDAEEARVLRDLIPHKKSFFCPFSSVLANMIKEKARNISISKSRKPKSAH